MSGERSHIVRRKEPFGREKCARRWRQADFAGASEGVFSRIVCVARRGEKARLCKREAAKRGKMIFF